MVLASDSQRALILVDSAIDCLTLVLQQHYLLRDLKRVRPVTLVTGPLTSVLTVGPNVSCDPALSPSAMVQEQCYPLRNMVGDMHTHARLILSDCIS